MISLATHLRFAGGLLLALAAAHLPFARRFHWREEASRLSPFNRQMLLVHAFFIALVVAMIGTLMIFWTDELLRPTPLGLPVAAGLTVFWGIRLGFQWLVYDTALWRGKRLETAAHIAFSALWLYLTILFALCWRAQAAPAARLFPH